MIVSTIQSGVIEITGTISNDSYLELYCVLKLDKPESFSLIKAKRDENEKGEGITSLIGWSRRAKFC